MRWRVPQSMQVAAAHEGLQLVGVTALVVQMAGMQRLMHIGHEMHQVLERHHSHRIRGL